jgi:hypothetical protein
VLRDLDEPVVSANWRSAASGEEPEDAGSTRCRASPSATSQLAIDRNVPGARLNAKKMIQRQQESNSHARREDSTISGLRRLAFPFCRGCSPM